MCRKGFVLCWLALVMPAAIDAPSAAERDALPIAARAATDAGAGAAGPSSLVADAGVTECAGLEAPVPENSSWAWRLRAYRYLDCVTAIVDNALGNAAAKSAASGVEPDSESGDDAVPMSRAELERIRNLAWWARDAAARIGY